MKIYIYIYIGSLCFDFPQYSAQYVEVERDIYWEREKTKRLLSSIQACYVITHSSGDIYKIPWWVSDHETGL